MMSCELYFQAALGRPDTPCLVAQFADNFLAQICKKALEAGTPGILLTIGDLMTANHPRYIVLQDYGVKKETIAQFEPDFGHLAEQFTLLLHKHFGPIYAMREIQPGHPNVKTMAPDGKGGWHQVGGGTPDRDGKIKLLS